MRRFSLSWLPLLALSACLDEQVTRTWGELLFVQGERLSTDATFTAPDTFMTETSVLEVPLRNVGRSQATVLSVTFEGGDESFVVEGAEGLTLEASTEATVRVRFQPGQADDATRASVPHTARFSFHLEGTREDDATVHLTVTGAALARDCYVPPELDFGPVPLHHAVTDALRLPNGATLTADTTWSFGDDAFTVMTASPLEVPAGGEAALPVRFLPTAVRAYEATLTLTRGPACPAGAVRLRGSGDDTAITWSPAALDFGRVPVGDIAAREVVFTNRSRVALPLSAVALDANFVVEPDLPAVLPALGTATVWVSCRPGQLGGLSGELRVSLASEPSYLAVVPLTCIGGGPRLRVTPNPLDFGTVPYNAVGTAATKRRMLVQNVGTQPVSAGNTEHNLFLGAGGALPWFAIVPRNAQTRVSEFSVGLVGDYDPAVGIAALAGDNLVEFEVSVHPTSPEPREADLLVYSNDSVQPVLTVPLSATPRAPEPCRLEVAEESVVFGPTPRGAVATRQVHLTNSTGVAGNQCLVSGIELAPGSDLAFRVTEPERGALLISNGQTSTITVEARVGSEAIYGAFLRGNLRFSVGSDGASRSLPVAAQVSQCLFVAPQVLDLGVVQETCTSAPRPVTLYNLCSVPLTVTSPSLPAPFVAIQSPFTGPTLTLLPGATTSLQVAVAPASVAQWTAPLTIEADQLGELVTQTVSLRARSNVDGFQEDDFTQDAAAVDILFVIDDSGSMGDEQAALASNFAAFISAATSGAGDWHLGVTTTDLYGQQGRLYGNPRVLTPATPDVAQTFAQNVSVGIRGSGWEQPFASMAAALSPDNLAGYNAGFLRSNAALAVVIVTDAVESSPNSVASYLAVAHAAKQNRAELVSVSVVGPFTPSGAGCSVEGLDNGRYAELVALSGGAQADICTSNWATSLQGISQAVFGSRRSFGLSGTPRSLADLTVRVGGMVLTSGWTWDPVRNAVIFSAPPTAGSVLNIGYRTACF